MKSWYELDGELVFGMALPRVVVSHFVHLGYKVTAKVMTSGWPIYTLTKRGDRGQVSRVQVGEVTR